MSTPSDSALQILVVDDNQTAAMAAAMLLRRDGHVVDVRHDGGGGIEALQTHPYDLVLTDLRMDPIDGLEVVRAARSCSPPVDAIVMTAYGSVDAAVEAMRLGAIDFLTKPVTADQLRQRVKDYRQSPAGGLALIGESAAMQQLRDSATRLATVRSTVLITGETGTGRRHLARWLHENGPDSDRPLVLAQAGRELSPDQLDQAGTLLLPNVDDWSTSAHNTLQRQLYRLDVGQPPRIVATASPDIGDRAAAGEMSAELYFRLAVLVLPLQPLRERPGDIQPLLEHFLDHHARVFGHPAPPLDDFQIRRFQGHAWPGNVRELRNLAERAVVMGAHAFEMPVRSPEPTHDGLPPLAEGFDLAEHLEWVERTMLTRAIEQTGGDLKAMVRVTGLERNRLRYKLNKFDLMDRIR
jgi:DNA-binding NtrC family response regulator